MVDTEMIMERLKRGAMAGGGAFAAGLVKGELQERTSLGEFGLAGTEIAGGVALSTTSNMVSQRRDSIPNDLLEYGGYGMQAAGFADLGSEISNSTQTGAHSMGSDEVIEVRADASQTSASGMSEEDPVVLNTS